MIVNILAASAILYFPINIFVIDDAQVVVKNGPLLGR